MNNDLRIQELAKDIIVANIQGHFVPNDQLQSMVRETITSLKAGFIDPEVEAEVEAVTQKNWRTSITQHYISCLLCDKKFKSLSAHLRTEHKINSKDYRKQFGIPAGLALSSKQLSAHRRKIARDGGAGERLKAAREAKRAAR